VPPAPLTAQLAPVPVVQLPTMFSVPLEVLLVANAFDPLPPIQFPTIVAELPDVPEKVTQTEFPKDPAKQFAVSVTPLESVNPPPAVAPPNVLFRTSPVAPRLVSTLTVMAKEFAMRTSPATNVTAPAVPLGVVAQTSEALMFPALRA
jgi:LysM repeat protein